jgi:hypothetical protein
MIIRSNSKICSLRFQLSTERGKTRTGNLGHPFLARVGNNMQQFRDSSPPYRRDNGELGEMGANASSEQPSQTDACSICRPPKL